MSHSRGRHRRPGSHIPAKTVAAVLVAAGVAGMVSSPASAVTPDHHAVQLMAAFHEAAPVLQVTWLTVRKGDTLSSLAGRFCRNPKDWTGLYLRNRHTVGADPDVIVPGERLIVACYQGHVNLPQHAQTAAVVSRPGHAHVVIRHHGLYYSFAGLEALWQQAGGPGWASWSAATIAECESGGYVLAHNPSGATGLWQILGSVVPGNLYDPYVNALNAVSKFKASGDTFAQWVCKA